MILQEICDLLWVAMQVNQWRDPGDCIVWFNKINSKRNHVFIKYDINDFYLYILEHELQKITGICQRVYKCEK